MYNYFIIHLLYFFKVIHYHTAITSSTVTICHHIICCHHHSYTLMMVTACYRNVGKQVSHLASVLQTFEIPSLLGIQ